MKSKQFPYTPQHTALNDQSSLPFVPITLIHQEQALQVVALVDSGSTVNVLPFDIGLKLGLLWEEQDFPLNVTGVLGNSPAYGVLLTTEVHSFPPIRLAFAWTRKTSNEIRVILGQINFFQAFKVSFDGKAKTFDLFLNQQA